MGRTWPQRADSPCTQPHLKEPIVVLVKRFERGTEDGIKKLGICNKREAWRGGMEGYMDKTADHGSWSGAKLP